MRNQDDCRIVLILGSAPDVVFCRAWPKQNGLKIVAINNAWRVRDDWDFLIAPDDFPNDRLPKSRADQQTLITSREYVPANNSFGGVFYAGGTMAFTAGYWALEVLKPTVMAFLGCDMNYSTESGTHFYGTGRPDPLRPDPSLRNLQAKSARLMMHARRLGCACVRLSSGESQLLFPSTRFENLFDYSPSKSEFPSALFNEAAAQEDRLGYYAPSGKYWEISDGFDVDQTDALDQMWLKAAGFAEQRGYSSSTDCRVN